MLRKAAQLLLSVHLREQLNCQRRLSYGLGNKVLTLENGLVFIFERILFSGTIAPQAIGPTGYLVLLSLLFVRRGPA